MDRTICAACWIPLLSVTLLEAHKLMYFVEGCRLLESL